MLVTDRVLFCASTEAAYRTRLRGIQRRARTVTEETGANNLFLTLGMLEWEDSKRQAKAPLFLLPVTLKAQRGHGSAGSNRGSRGAAGRVASAGRAASGPAPASHSARPTGFASQEAEPDPL
jgi:hypothetical protein